MQRTHPDQSSGIRDDNNSTGGQWDDSMGQGNQGKWEHKEDTTGGTGGNTYSPQNLGYEYGSNTSQAATGPGGMEVQSDRYPSSGQHSGPGMATTGQTAGYVDPRLAGGVGRQTDDDDEYRAAVGAGGQTGKPSMTSRVKGAAEKMAGKITGDPVKEARGREREEGTF